MTFTYSKNILERCEVHNFGKFGTKPKIFRI